MDRYIAKEELVTASQVVTATIKNCENMQPKFLDGTAQATLLKNRVQALYIAKSLITNDGAINQFTMNELQDALAPISSIISKCAKGQLKYAEGTAPYTRYQKIIKAMDISKTMLLEELKERLDESV